MRKIDWFTASHERVDVQKLSRVFAVYVCVMYMSCSVCAKTLSSFCVYEQRLCHVFAMYVIAMHVNRSDKAKNRSIYCISQTCRCAKAESCFRSVCMNVVYKLNVESSAVTALCVIAMCVNRSENGKIDRFAASRKFVDAQKLSRAFAVYVCVTYMSCSACAKTLLLFCVYEQRLCHVFAMFVIVMHVNWFNKAKNWLIYCITQTCRCVKAESCLRNISVYVICELNVWIKCCYCSVCDYAACKSIWKCEKSIDLLHHVCLYMRKSWVVSLQYICIWRKIVINDCKWKCWSERRNYLFINESHHALLTSVNTYEMKMKWHDDDKK